MSGVVVLTCNARGRECQQLRAVEHARSLPAARARAAVFGWSTWQRQGLTLDACPVCASAASVLAGLVEPVAPVELTTDRLVAVLMHETAAERSAPAPGTASAMVRPRHAAQLLPEGAEVCDACADGEHRRCRGCACRSVEHSAHPGMPVRAPAGR